MKRLTFLLLVTIVGLFCQKCKPPLENAPAFIRSITANRDSVYPGDTVSLNFDYFDAEGDSIDIRWSSRSGRMIPDSTSRVGRWISPKIPGDYFIWLRISDRKDSLADVDSIGILVIDRPGTFTDLRDGHTYKWVKIGNQVWMAENLAYLPYVSSGLGNPSGYFVNGYQGYGSSTAEAKQAYNYQKYGVLYGHESAKSACPSGWHLSTDDEWKALEIYLGMNPAMANQYHREGTQEIARSLMSDILWSGNNSSGFGAVPGGSIYCTHISGSYIGDMWHFERPGNAYYLSPATGSTLYRQIGYQIDRDLINADIEGFSVRCVKDE